ncbi:MAG TPA: M23 family metallopeptidase, partial [Thermoanaerobaculia bacterium]|nr:M23 family metallopeptidase [Thermoanaerobaculia bacterium]
PPSGSRPFRRRGLELQLVPEDPLRRALRLRLGPWATRLLGLLALLATAGSVAGWATLPRTLSGPRAERTMAVQSARRIQLGERLQALTAELGESARRVAGATRRVEKAHRLMALPSHPAPKAAAAEGEVDSIFSAVARRGRELEGEVAAALVRLEKMLDEVERVDRQRPPWLATVPSISPLGRSESVLVAGFGPRRNPYTQELDFHAGLDLAAPLGTPIMAPADGRVLFAGVFERQEGDWWRLGRVVAIRHGERYLTIFGHCADLLVGRGESVRRGEEIATVGKSGWSTTVHLHYEVREGVGGAARAVDPRLHILDASWDDEENLFEGASRPGLRAGAPLPRALR